MMASGRVRERATIVEMVETISKGRNRRFRHETGRVDSREEARERVDEEENANAVVAAR
jgi:hypothetical protein